MGAVVSPLLANVYLHYVFDLWVHQWRRRRVWGEMVVVRYADDFVVGFQHRGDAEQFWAALRERFAKFGLGLHEEKTRLIEFGRFAAQSREARGLGRPETFEFLGFTHISARSRAGWFKLQRITSKKRMRAKLREVKTELMRRRHLPIAEQGQWLRNDALPPPTPATLRDAAVAQHKSNGERSGSLLESRTIDQPALPRRYGRFQTQPPCCGDIVNDDCIRGERAVRPQHSFSSKALWRASRNRVSTVPCRLLLASECGHGAVVPATATQQCGDASQSAGSRP